MKNRLMLTRGCCGSRLWLLLLLLIPFTNGFDSFVIRPADGKPSSQANSNIEDDGSEELDNQWWYVDISSSLLGEADESNNEDLYNVDSLSIQLRHDMPIWTVYNTKTDNDKDLKYFLGETNDKKVSFQVLRYVQPESLISVVQGVVEDFENQKTYSIQMDWEGNYFVRVVNPEGWTPHGEEADSSTTGFWWDMIEGIYQQPGLSLVSLWNRIRGFHPSQLPRAMAYRFGYYNPIPSTITSEDAVMIDIAVIWTENAECYKSFQDQGCTLTDTTKTTMEADVAMWLEQTNLVFRNSETGTILNLVHQQRDSSSYQEGSKNNTEILLDLQGACDGNMDYVHSLRDTHKADLVVLIYDGEEPSCGQACFAACGGCWADSTLGFSITRVPCTLYKYLPAHEIGHNFGCLHDQGTDGACGTTCTNRGYRSPSGNFHTVMAYSCTTGECDNNPEDWCRAIPYYSGKDATYEGEPMGGTRNDCRSEININKFNIANFR